MSHMICSFEQSTLQEFDNKKASMESCQESANIITEKSTPALTEKINKEIEDRRHRWQKLIDDLRAREKVRGRGTLKMMKCFMSLWYVPQNHLPRW